MIISVASGGIGMRVNVGGKDRSKKKLHLHFFVDRVNNMYVNRQL